MSEPFLGQVIAVGFNFAPVGWAFCNGALLSISQNDALYSLLGTTYGGDGVNTFGLPNLQGRVPVNQGTGPGLSNYVMGQVGGVESVNLSAGNLPTHTHTAGTANSAGSTNIPGSNTVLSNEGPGTPQITTYVAFANQQPLVGSTISNTGNSVPHENRQPLLAINFIIALQGIYPSQT
jgi:microcystin-dependent protein